MPGREKFIPDGYTAVTPYLVCDGAAQAIAFYQKVFGAELLYPPLSAPGGRIGHAELRFGDAVVMLADEHPAEGHRGPRAFGGSPVSLLLYVKDVDETFRAALAAGAKELRPVKDQFYGDRSGMIADPFGHLWTVSTNVETVSPEEMERRMKAERGG